MSTEPELANLLAARAGIDVRDAERWLCAYVSAPPLARQMLKRWLETGEYPSESVEGSLSAASLAEQLPPIEVFDLIDMLVREPPTGKRMVARALRESSGRRAET